MSESIKRIRNFVIISHVDHGKSTLADRFLELTNTVDKRKMREQYLDQMELEREKGITIKMQPVRMQYKLKVKNEKLKIDDNETFNFELFTLNLIDTPGHVDFSYEVSRALAAVEGAILLVDATQGVQAQTVANLALAQKERLVIIPAINKIDLPSANIQKTEEELQALMGVSGDEILKVSAKEGRGVREILEAVIEKIPCPTAREPSLRALVFDSIYDPYHGVLAHIRIFAGQLQKGEKIFFMATAVQAEALEVGVFLPERRPMGELVTGEIGYVATGIKEPEKVRVGDTITKFKVKSLKSKVVDKVEALPGYREPEAMVFASIFPENQDDFEKLREALKKLKLNDAALTFDLEEATVLGRGFRAGFLGVLHMEIASERLEREYGLKLVFANPSVAFRIIDRRGEERIIRSALELPASGDIKEIHEPWVRLEVITPPQFIGAILKLISAKDGQLGESMMLASGRMILRGEAPLREIIVDFYDQLKSVSQGFASLAYEISGWREAEFVRLDIIVGGQRMPVMAEIIPRARVYARARERVEKLKELLPRELFSVALQAEAEGRIIARQTLPALRKDVAGYLYGGDRTRKMKLWAKQKRGKRRLEARGQVRITPEVFLKLIKR